MDNLRSIFLNPYFLILGKCEGYVGTAIDEQCVSDIGLNWRYYDYPKNLWIKMSGFMVACGSSSGTGMI